jgi:drug/metabolite transporter (DMT)-like permease
MSLLTNWILLSVIAGLASNAFNFINRYLLKDKEDSTAYTWFYEVTRFFAFAIIAIFDWKLVITSYSVVIFLLLGITEWIAAYWYMKMHKHAHLSISSILSRTRLIWVPVLAYLIIHESLKTPDYIGIIILFVGLSVVVSPKKLFIDKGANYANLAAFMIALNIVITKMALPYGSNAVINGVMALIPALLFPLFIPNSSKRLKKIFQNNLPIKLIAIVFNVISIYLFTAALRIGNSGKVTAIYQGMIIVSILAGIIFLKERKDIGKKLIGAAITITGVVVLSFY